MRLLSLCQCLVEQDDSPLAGLSSVEAVMTHITTALAIAGPRLRLTASR